MNLFVVNTPLQLLNAVEARSAFNITDCTLVILMWPHWSRTPFESILRNCDFHRVEYFLMHKKFRLREPTNRLEQILDLLQEYYREVFQLVFRRKFSRFLQRHSPVDHLFIGNYRNDYMIHIANIIEYSSLILLDDGTDALTVARMRLSRATKKPSGKKGIIRHLKDIFREKYIDWDNTQAPEATLFTSYSVQVTGNDKTIHNNYTQLKATLRKADKSDEIYFLGQPLIADGYLDDTTFAAYLAKVKDDFSGRPLYYIAHPREKDIDFSDVASSLGFKIIRFEAPIEVVLCSAARIPAVIASFFCSALENCSFLYPERLKIIAYEIPDMDLLCCHELVKNTYDHFRTNRNNSINIMPLDIIRRT